MRIKEKGLARSAWRFFLALTLARESFDESAPANRRGEAEPCPFSAAHSFFVATYRTLRLRRNKGATSGKEDGERNVLDFSVVASPLPLDGVFAAFILPH